MYVMSIMIHLYSSIAHHHSITSTTHHHFNADKAINATPLSVAVMNGHYKCVDALVRYGVDVNTRFDFPLFNGTKTSSTLMTPIMLACMYGQSQMVNLLLAYNANCMLTDSSDSNILHYALNEGPNALAVFTILHTLLEEINLRQLVLAADKKGYSPLHNACISNHVDVIPILVGLGCNVDIRTRPPKVRENVLERTLRKSNNLGMEFKTSDFCKSIRMIDLTDNDDEVEVEVEGADVKGKKILGDKSKRSGVSGEMKCDTSIPSLGALRSGQKTPPVVVETVLPSTVLVKPEDEVKKKKEAENGVGKGMEKDVEKEIEKGMEKGNDNVKNRRRSSFSSDGIAWGVTPLHIAVKRRSLAAVTSLLNANADPCATKG
jgi:ankyrin repeat protein